MNNRRLLSNFFFLGGGLGEDIILILGGLVCAVSDSLSKELVVSYVNYKVFHELVPFIEETENALTSIAKNFLTNLTAC